MLVIAPWLLLMTRYCLCANHEVTYTGDNGLLAFRGNTTAQLRIHIRITTFNPW